MYTIVCICVSVQEAFIDSRAVAGMLFNVFRNLLLEVSKDIRVVFVGL